MGATGRSGALTSNFAEAGGFLKTRSELAVPDIQLHFVAALVDDHARKFHLGHGLSCHVCLLRPHSRGSVILQSGAPQAAPLIDPAFFQDPRDIEDMVAGFKLTRRLMQAPAMAESVALPVSGRQSWHLHRLQAWRRDCAIVGTAQGNVFGCGTSCFFDGYSYYRSWQWNASPP